MDSKVELRKLYKDRRSSIVMEKFHNGNKSICASLANNNWYKEARIVMAYLAIGKEVCLDEFINYALQDGKKIYVPYCTEEFGIMKAISLTSLADVVEEKFKIRVPRDLSNEISPEEIDLVIVPGVAFDEEGGRLGMGGGYYDRFLQKNHRCIGVAWDVQISPKPLPIEEHDIRMGQIITESKTLICKTNN